MLRKFKKIVICSGHTQTTCRSISPTHKFRSRYSNSFRTNCNVLASGKTSYWLDIVYFCCLKCLKLSDIIRTTNGQYLHWLNNLFSVELARAWNVLRFRVSNVRRRLQKRDVLRRKNVRKSGRKRVTVGRHGTGQISSWFSKNTNCVIVR